MVLIGARTPVLVGLLVGLLGGLVAGCGESLFDARGPADGGRPVDGRPDDAGELGTCTTPCIADASADFDGTPAGRNGRWRYVDDLGNRQWTQMTVDGMQMVGNAARSIITTCAASPDRPACAALPRALLVTSAGAAGGAGAGGADPAIEFTSPSTQGIELRVRAFLPAGDSQQIRLYRNSREDVLFTGLATPGTALEQTVTLDALAGDRFLVAVAASGPTGGGATDLGLHLTVTATNSAFPSSCQLALGFETQTGSSVIDLCQAAVYSLRRVPGGTLAPLTRGAGPFFEQGSGARIPEGTHFAQIAGNKTLDHTAGLTIQFWMQHAVPIGVEPVWPFSDHDPEFGSGIAVTLQAVGQVAPMIDVTGFADGSFVHAIGQFPADVMRWQFVRVVHTATEIALCVNGVRVAAVAATNAAIPTVNTPLLGSEQFPSVATFDGSLDDVRALTGALPCE